MNAFLQTLRRITATLILGAAALAGATAQTAVTYQPTAENIEARKAFAERRFGIFIHWGIYSMFAQGEWYMQNAKIDCNEYAKAAQAFFPHNFNAYKWIDAFRDAGARYICFTTRHHDGFSMWNTSCSDYNIMHTPYGKDIVGQLAEACHAKDMGFHLYYSHLDWTREDYPLGRTGHGTRKTLKPNWNSYYKFMNDQLTELLTRYGRVDCIWFDGLWDHDSDSVPFNWQLEEQYALIHRLQPACLIGNNHHLTPFAGEDIQLFERDVPGENKAGLSGQEVSRLPLETCQTMNGMWGYKVQDQNYKSVNTLIRLLARTSAKGANLLLNVGPQPDGSIPEAALSRLHEMGQWLRRNGDAIYGTDGVEYALGGDSIVCTRTDSRLYVHVLSPNVKSVSGLPVASKPKDVRPLADRQRVNFRYNKKEGLEITDINMPANAADYVIEVVLKD